MSQVPAHWISGPGVEFFGAPYINLYLSIFILISNGLDLIIFINFKGLLEI